MFSSSHGMFFGCISKMFYWMVPRCSKVHLQQWFHLWRPVENGGPNFLELSDSHVAEDSMFYPCEDLMHLDALGARWPWNRETGRWLCLWGDTKDDSTDLFWTFLYVFTILIVSYSLIVFLLPFILYQFIEGSLEVKLPTIWTAEKQSREEAERRGRLEERRVEEKE